MFGGRVAGKLSLTFPNGVIVPVYDGSLMEWSLQHDLPMELPAHLQPLNSLSGYGRGTTQEADEGLLLFGSGWMSA